MSAKLTTDQFIEKAKLAHGNKFDYSKVNYIDSQTKVIIICPLHGEFEQKPNKHLSGQGCPLCNKKQAIEYPIYEERFPLIEGKKYIVSDLQGDFTTDDYRNKSGVITTYLKETYNIESGMSSFKERNYFKTYNRYWWEEYLEIKLVDDIKKQTIKCPYCDWETIDMNNQSGMMITHFKKVHGKQLEDVLKEHPELKEYFSNTKSIDLRSEDEYVVCQICGKKLGSVNHSHLKKHGITKSDYILKYRTPTLSQVVYQQCVSQALHMNEVNGEKDGTDLFTSASEKEIKKHLTSLGIANTKNRSILSGKELDIYIPSHNIAIEYNGCKWHTEWFGKKDRVYHYNKLVECNEKGVRLIHLFEDEYMYHKEIVLSKIEHILGIHKDLPVISARKCTITKISKPECDAFLNINHIQGETNASAYYGAKYENTLVAVMTFTKCEGTTFALSRFATDNHFLVSGIANRLLKRFIKEYKPNKIISFADRRWTIDLENNLYTKLGFVLESCTKPDYRYYNEKVDKFKRFHKFGFRKQILNKKYGLPLNMTEEEMVKELGYDRIWDCGLAKYVLNVKS